RQINLATQMFTVDHRDRMPWTNWDAGNPAQSLNEPGWLYDARVPGGEPNFAIEDGQIHDYMKIDAPFLCPLDQDLIEELPGVRRLSSYVMNGAVSAYAVRTPFRIADFNSGDVLFWELDEQDASGSWNDGANRPNEAPTQRHEGAGMVTRFDASAAPVKQDEWEEWLAQRPGPLYCNPASRNGT
ncbi:MAG: hypothetical protein AAF078_13070, partial [Planctomycetota bacterium]